MYMLSKACTTSMGTIAASREAAKDACSKGWIEPLLAIDASTLCTGQSASLRDMPLCDMEELVLEEGLHASLSSAGFNIFGLNPNP